MSNVYSKISRCRTFLLWLAQVNQQHCYFCNEPINPEAFVEGNTGDGILLHHKDHDRSHNEPSNLGIAHRTCHRKHHIANNKRMATLVNLQAA